jgi:hypothetical protein
MILKEKVLFSKEDCKSILSLNNTHVTNWRLKDRKYDSQPIGYMLDTKWIFDRLKTFFESETGLEIKKNKEEIHFHKFTKGDWFGKHNDTRDYRIYAVGVLLNDDFIGGDFNFFNPTERTINKIVGNSYIFDVRIEHEITPIINGERYSLLWFLQHEHIKIETNKLI